MLCGAWGIQASQDFRGSKIEDVILRIGLKNMRIVLLKSIPKDVRGVIVDIQLMTRLSSVNDNRVEFTIAFLLSPI